MLTNTVKRQSERSQRWTVQEVQLKRISLNGYSGVEVTENEDVEYIKCK